MFNRIYQFFPLIAKICLVVGAASHCAAKHTELSAFDDWIIGGSCSQNASILCNGYYSQKIFPPTSPKTQKSDPITVHADSAKFVAVGTSTFQGNVVATKSNKALYADRAEVVHNKNGDLEKISAFGNVKLMQPGIRIDGSQITAHILQKREVITDPVYRLYARHARGSASSAILLRDNKLILKDSTYTTCAPNSNAWYLYAKHAELDKNTGRGQAWGAAFYAKDVPIFYFPYVNFPLDKRRQSGWLQPSYENSSLNGKTLILPFYWNMAPNYDSTITANYMSLRGTKFDTNFRYLTRSSYGAIDFDFLPHDRAYRALRNNLYADSAFMTSTASDNVVRRNDLGHSNYRYRFAAKAHSYLHPNWLFSLDFTHASDGNYLYDFIPQRSNYVTDKASILYALQRATLQNFNPLGLLRAQIERFETFHVVNGPSGSAQLTKLPAIDFNSAIYRLPANFEAYANLSYVNFRPNVIPFSGEALTFGQRVHVKPALAYPFEKTGWFILPRAQLNYVQYDHLNVAPNDLARGVKHGFTKSTIPIYDLKAGMIFDRQAMWHNVQFLQTLEPTAYYLFVPRKNQNHIPNLDSGLLTFDYNQLFRDNRYTGEDYVGDANQLSLGLASKFYDPISGAEYGMVGIGKIKYFRNTILLLDQELDHPSKKWSPWAFVAKLYIDSNYNLEANLITTHRRCETASLQLQYKPSALNVVNFSYELVQDPQPDDLTGLLNSNLNQIGASSAWHLRPSLRLLGKVNYDLRFHRFLDAVAGIEYHSCCTAMRIVWSRTWLPELYRSHGSDNRLRLQIIFKGFGGVGNAEDKHIASLIPGYSALR